MFNKFNNNGNGTSVNTRLYTSYADDSLLVLSAWNGNLSYKIQPAKGKNDDGLTVYSTEQQETFIGAITAETNQTLLKSFDDVIIPAINDGRSASIAVVAGSATSRKILNFTTENKQVKLTLIFGGNINLDCTSENTFSVTHTFNDRTYSNDYKKDVGGETVTIPSDFYAFLSKLRDFNNIDSSIAHGISYTNEVKSHYRKGGSDFTQQPQQQTVQNNYSAPVVNAGDESLDTMIPFV
jgi:hypothetical protein